VAGRETASVEPYVAAVVTAPPVGIALRPGPAPAITVPITSASPRTGRCRWRRFDQLLGDQGEARPDGTAVWLGVPNTGGLGMSLRSGRTGRRCNAPYRSARHGIRLAPVPRPIRQLGLWLSGRCAVFYSTGAPNPLRRCRLISKLLAKSDFFRSTTTGSRYADRLVRLSRWTTARSSPRLTWGRSAPSWCSSTPCLRSRRGSCFPTSSNGRDHRPRLSSPSRRPLPSRHRSQSSRLPSPRAVAGGACSCSRCWSSSQVRSRARCWEVRTPGRSA